MDAVARLDAVCSVLDRLGDADFAVLEPVLLPWVRRDTGCDATEEKNLLVFLSAGAASSPMMASPDGLPGIALDNGGQFLVCGIASKPAMSHNRQAGQQRRDHGRAAGNRHRIRRIGASRWPGGAASALRRLARRLPMSPAIGAGRIGLDNKGYRGQAVWRESLRLSRFLSGSRVR